jgi:hypothetical protein
MPRNRQKNSIVFTGTGVNEIEYDVNGNPTGFMPVRTTSETQATPPTSPARISSVAEIQYDALGNPIGSFPTVTAPGTQARTQVRISSVDEIQYDTLGNPIGTFPVDDAPVKAPSQGGSGSGTSPNAYESRGNDDTPPPSNTATQQAINQAFGTVDIVPQSNVLDQYASYTYAISWWLLTPDQYNNLTSGLAPAPGTGNWTLLIQSGGAPVGGRNQYFPNDYYFDDLEIESFLMGKGTNMSNNGMELRFKVVEPNGITLIQNLYSAVTAAYKSTSSPAGPQSNANTNTVNANQTRQDPNYVAAQYCLTIEFYGYDSQGNLVAPVTGQYSATGQADNTSAQPVIKKYYPFLIQNISFRTVANQIEYNVVGSPVPYSTGTAQARGTIPYAFELAGQTVSQLLLGSPVSASNSATNVPDGRISSPAPVQKQQRPQPRRVTVAELPMKQQAAIAAGTDPNTVNDQGMAFGGGGL